MKKGIGESKATQVPEVGKVRSALTAWVQHREKCVTGYIEHTQPNPSGGVKIVHEAVNGCAAGRLCNKGARLLAEWERVTKEAT